MPALTYGTLPPKPLNSLPNGTGSAPLPYVSQLLPALTGTASLSLDSSISSARWGCCAADGDDAAVDAGGAGAAKLVDVETTH